MQNSGSLSKNNSLRLTPQQSIRRLGLCSQVATGQQTSPIVFPEKRSKVKASRRADTSVTTEDLRKGKRDEHRIDIVDEKSDLLGYEVLSGKLALDKRKTRKTIDAPTKTEVTNQDMLDAKLTSKALVWGSDMLHLDDVISVTYNVGLRHFTVHAYPIRKKSFLKKSGRSRKDFRFLATSSDEAVHWVAGFAEQQCFVNCLPHPLKQTPDINIDFTIDWQIKSKSPPRMLVILNPRSGHGRSTKVFHDTVEPIFKLAGFQMEVVKTTSAGHARKLASSVDFSTCPDGIICVGGDGIINEQNTYSPLRSCSLVRWVIGSNGRLGSHFILRSEGVVISFEVGTVENFHFILF